MRELVFIGSSRDDLRGFPSETTDVIGFALYTAQMGGKDPNAKPLQGFHGAGVLEVVDDYDGDTYRTVYTVRLSQAIYVLHAFQKKSKRGNETPQTHLDRIKERLKMAEAEDARRRAAAIRGRGQG